MTAQVDAIAERIKELREIFEYTPQQVAEAAGVSVEQYMTFEEGGRDIPVSVLYALADFYKVEMVTLLTGGRELLLIEGECIFFDSTIPHGMRSVGDKEAKMLVVIV